MDPYTASILLLVGAGSMYMQWDADNKRQVEAQRLMGEQRYARSEAIRSEIGAANQLQTNSMGAANKQTKPNQSPSFAAGSMLGNLPSVKDTNNTPTSSGTSGTF